ncbi:MAG: hypothetical protein QM487_14975 [Candidatus Marithrix sp.]
MFQPKLIFYKKFVGDGINDTLQIDLPLSDYYLPFLSQIDQFAKEQGQSEPSIEKDGKLHQKIYFTRTQKID